MEENTKEIINQIQMFMHAKENSALQMEIILESQDYNKEKQEIVNRKLGQYNKGEFKGSLSLSNFVMEFEGVQLDKELRLRLEFAMNVQTALS